jgi:acetyl-CoA synthetase
MSAEVAWRPSREAVERSNYARFFRDHQLSGFDELLRKADGDPAWFYDAAIRWLGLPFFEPYSKVLDLSRGPAWAKWCVGGTTNLTLNVLDKHRGAPTENKLAISYEGEAGERGSWSYAELDAETCRLAGALKELGIGSGDAVGVFMPMRPETTAAFLAIARIGAITIPLFSGFGPEAIAARLADSQAKAVVTVDAARRRGQLVPMKATLDAALAKAPSVKHVIVLDHARAEAPWTKGRDLRWRDVVARQAPRIDATPVPAEHPLLIIYTSGTTGRPKGAVITHVGVATKISFDMQLHMDFGPADRLIWLTDFGWVVGPMTMYGPLAAGGSIVLAEGGPDYPDKGRMWRLAAQHEATILGVAPTSVRTLMRHGADEVRKHDLSKLRAAASTGEPWTDEAWMWLFENALRAEAPIVNWAGGTEIGGGILCGTLIHPLKPCALSAPVPGMGADVVDEKGNSVGPGEVGELVLRIPSIGLTKGLYKDPERYMETYWSTFPDLWRHGDWASRDGDGQWFVHGRSDDTLKISGKRTGPAEIEGLVMATGKVSEAAAIGVPDPIKGQSVMCVCVAAPGVAPDAKLAAEIEQAVADGMGKSFRPGRVLFVPDLPKTRSMKIMRRVVRALVLGDPPGDLSSLSNPESIDLLKQAASQG